MRISPSPLRTCLLAIGASLLLSTAPGSARAEGKASKVVLLEAGKAPRRALRYKLRVGAKEKIHMATDMSMKMDMGGTAIPETSIPTIEMVMAVAVTKKLSEEEFGYDFEIESATARKRPGVMDSMVPIVQQALDSAKGITGTAIVDTRGFNRDINVKLPEGLAPQMQQMLQGMNKGLDQMSSPFPAEAVGKGAKWRVTQVVEQGGMKLDQHVTFELVELSGNTGKLKVRIEQSAKQQTINVNGMSAELTSYRGTGAGTAKIDLRRLVPITTMKLTSDYAMKLPSVGALNGHMEMAMTIKRK